MQDTTRSAKPAPVWKRLVASTLDFLTVFFVGGTVIARLTGGTTPDGFSLTGWPALTLIALIVAYFYIGRRIFRGTLWDHALRIGRPQPRLKVRNSSTARPAGHAELKPAPAWRRLVASTLDFVTVVLGGGALIAYLTGTMTPNGFKLEGWPFMALLALFIAYFYIGRRKLGGTLWDRVFGIRRPQAED